MLKNFFDCKTIYKYIFQVLDKYLKTANLLWKNILKYILMEYLQ